MADTENNRDQQGSMEPTATVPAIAEWMQQGSVASWINQLEMYKRESKFKWRNLRQLKRKGFKVGFDVKERFPELYAMSVGAFDSTGIIIPDQARMEKCDQTVMDLVRFLGQLAKLVKDFRSFYSPSKVSSEMLIHLAKRNPKVFQIRETGSTETGYSAKIKIGDMLTATEVGENAAVAKWLVSTKVLQYMMQLSKMVEVPVAPDMEDKPEPEVPGSCSHSSSRASILAESDYFEPVSVQSVDLNDLAQNEMAQIEVMAQKLVESIEKSILFPTKSSVNWAKSKRYSTI